MGWDHVESNWKQVKSMVKARWDRLSDGEIDQIAGRRDRLAGKLLEHYGITPDQAERELREWEDAIH